MQDTSRKVAARLNLIPMQLNLAEINGNKIYDPRLLCVGVEAVKRWVPAAVTPKVQKNQHEMCRIEDAFPLQLIFPNLVRSGETDTAATGKERVLRMSEVAGGRRCFSLRGRSGGPLVLRDTGKGMT